MQKNLAAMNFKKTLFIIGLFLLQVKISTAQLNNNIFYNPIAINKSDSGKFEFSAHILNYMRNTEYFNKIELGRTLFGVQFHPNFSYQPSPNIKIQAGLFLRSDFGGEQYFTQAIPTFTIKTKYHNLEMLFGTLEGASNHQIIEPLFDIARTIENRIENGFQLKYNNEKTFFDSWINWEKFIERGTPHKEKFTAGINFTKSLFNPNKKLDLQGICQGMLSHAGGQIDADTVNPLTMQANYTLGAKAIYKVNKKNSVAVDAYFLGYKDTGDSTFIPFNQGSAVYSNISYQNSQFQFMLSYFLSDNFIAPRGTAIYQSQSIDNPKHFETTRQLVIPRIIYRTDLFNQLKMSARFEPVYDLEKRFLDYSYSFYLSYNINKKLN